MLEPEVRKTDSQESRWKWNGESRTNWNLRGWAGTHLSFSIQAAILTNGWWEKMASFIMEVRAVSHELSQHLEQWISQGWKLEPGQTATVATPGCCTKYTTYIVLSIQGWQNLGCRKKTKKQITKNVWCVVTVMGNMESGVWRMKAWEALIWKQHLLLVSCTFLGERGEIHSLLFQSLLLLAFVKDGAVWLPLTPCPW